MLMSYFQHLWLNFKKTIIQKMSIVCKLPIQELLLLKLFVHLPIVKKHNKILSILGRRLYLCSNINASKVYQLKKILKKRKKVKSLYKKKLLLKMRETILLLLLLWIQERKLKNHSEKLKNQPFQP